MSWSVGSHLSTSYDVRMKVLEGSTTPQNRLILCKADAALQARRNQAMEAAQYQLDRAYERAHAPPGSTNYSKKTFNFDRLDGFLQKSLPLIGSFCLGAAVTLVLIRR